MFWKNAVDQSVCQTFTPSVIEKSLKSGMLWAQPVPGKHAARRIEATPNFLSCNRIFLFSPCQSWYAPGALERASGAFRKPLTNNYITFDGGGQVSRRMMGRNYRPDAFNLRRRRAASLGMGARRPPRMGRRGNSPASHPRPFREGS